MPITIGGSGTPTSKKWLGFILTMIVGLVVETLGFFGIVIDAETKARILTFLASILGVYTAGNLGERGINALETKFKNGKEVKT